MASCRTPGKEAKHGLMQSYCYFADYLLNFIKPSFNCIIMWISILLHIRSEQIYLISKYVKVKFFISLIKCKYLLKPVRTDYM